MVLFHEVYLKATLEGSTVITSTKQLKGHRAAQLNVTSSRLYFLFSCWCYCEAAAQKKQRDNNNIKSVNSIADTPAADTAVWCCMLVVVPAAVDVCVGRGSTR